MNGLLKLHFTHHLCTKELLNACMERTKMSNRAGFQAVAEEGIRLIELGTVTMRYFFPPCLLKLC